MKRVVWVVASWFVVCFVQAAELSPTDNTIVETVLRMQQFDLASSEKAQGAVTRYLDAKPGSENYFKLIERFKIVDRVPELIGQVGESTAGLQALKLALKLDEAAVKQTLADEQYASQLSKALPLLRNPTYDGWIKVPVPPEGSGANPTPVQSVAPLPAIADLMKLPGNATAGQAVYTRGCAICHQPSALPIDFGPNLSEIGDKLPREDLFRSILEPSAAVSMGFEGHEITLKGGGQVVGLVPSETDEFVTVVMMGGIRQEIKKSEIQRRRMLKTSLMPPGLHETMSRQELADLVAYLLTLKKK